MSYCFRDINKSRPKSFLRDCEYLQPAAVSSSSSCAIDDEVSTTDQVMRDEATFIQDVSQFFNQEALSDIILKVGDDSYYAHKFVLAKSSDVFRTMLYERNWSQGVKTEIELEEPEECRNVFEKFLKFLYTAQLLISNTTAVGILCLADKYNVTSLKELCTKYMIENSRSPRVANALSWYSWAKLLHMTSLLSTCTKTIAWNYGTIITSSEWSSMDIEFLCDFLKSSELVVPNEFAIWNAVCDWLTNESRKDNLSENVSRLLPLIRFPQMLVHQLHKLEQCELATNAECVDVFGLLLSRAYRYRALCPSQAQLDLSFSEPFYLPRDYTDLSVDNVRIQNTLRFGIQVDVKTTRGPVPSESRDADWKVTYRKQGDTWSMQFYCHETALVNNEARIEPSIIVFNDSDKVIQVHREGQLLCGRGSTVQIQMMMDHPDLAKSMGVLIKPIPT